MAVGAEEVAGVATGGAAVTETRATRGVAARGVTVGAKERTTALTVLRLPVEDALGVELTTGGGEFWRTRNRKE